MRRRRLPGTLRASDGDGDDDDDEQGPRLSASRERGRPSRRHRIQRSWNRLLRRSTSRARVHPPLDPEDPQSTGAWLCLSPIKHIFLLSHPLCTHQPNLSHHLPHTYAHAHSPTHTHPLSLSSKMTPELGMDTPVTRRAHWMSRMSSSHQRHADHPRNGHENITNSSSSNNNNTGNSNTTGNNNTRHSSSSSSSISIDLESLTTNSNEVQSSSRVIEDEDGRQRVEINLDHTLEQIVLSSDRKLLLNRLSQRARLCCVMLCYAVLCWGLSSPLLIACSFHCGVTRRSQSVPLSFLSPSPLLKHYLHPPPHTHTPQRLQPCDTT